MVITVGGRLDSFAGRIGGRSVGLGINLLLAAGRYPRLSVVCVAMYVASPWWVRGGWLLALGQLGLCRPSL